ncbi:hypothetical protein PV08_11011 [Exophiala spinifera]|uniref:Uncharacterized protein n=1 Tax=Exophiala spinifera TaxID=91928 RepID=A0A0D2BKA2_9EURO|nr:uncharacterized protein PV08_11011 [Exophiala spinifera]KIW11709.1 hypothetical protein PV08_11011 [Exophiala spinifera]
MRTSLTRSRSDGLNELAAALRESIESFMASTDLYDATTPLLFEDRARQTSDPSDIDIPYRRIDEQGHEESSNHESEVVRLLTDMKTDSEAVRLLTDMRTDAEAVRLLTDMREQSRPVWPTTTITPSIQTSSQAQGLEADHDSRPREVSEEDFAGEWWDLCSESSSDTDSDTDTDKEHGAQPDLDERPEREPEPGVADTRPEPERSIDHWTIVARLGIIPEDFQLDRPQQRLLKKGQLLKYAMINWQMVCLRRWSLEREN